VEIDDTIVFSVTEADAGTYATYAEVVLDISAYADGGSHKLEFYSEVSLGSNLTNFFVDDVSIAAAMAAACDAPADIPWLSVSPTSGTTVSGTSSLIDVTFDATGLSPSVYTGTLCIESNDAMTPLVTVPVMLTVDASISYGVSVAPDAAMTGEVGTTVTYMLEVMNTGNTADTFDLAVTGNNWNTTLSESSVSLNAGNSATIMVTVNIPAIATDGAMDTVTVMATSQGDGAVSDSATLTTTAVVTGPPTIYLPVFIKD
jgi:hypothetical protein